jgi:hypothetical protein
MSVPVNAGNSREEKTPIMRRGPALAKPNCEAFLIKLFLKVCRRDRCANQVGSRRRYFTRKTPR